eukprot:s796_g15.t1
MCGIVIDDFVALSKGPRNQGDAKNAEFVSKGASLANQAQELYKSVHLIPHEAKASRDETKSEFWGAQVDGQRGVVRASLKRAAPLLKVISLVLQLGVISVSNLEIIAGGVISLFTYRRRLMSLMSEVFEEMKGRTQRCVISIGQSLRDELLSITLLIPCAVSDLRADFCPEVFAVDASMWGEAVCSSPVTVQLARELGRHVLTKGVWTHLLSPYKARARSHGDLDPSSELPGGAVDIFRTHPLWSLLASGLQFRLRWKRRAACKRHINIGELRSFLRAERLGKRRSKASRLLIGGDSQVALGALLKGRSSSPSLNRELQKSLGPRLGLGLFPSYFYFPTSINPSNAQTRDREIPAPSRELPDWWHEALQGDFRGLDAWLSDRAADPYSLSGLPNLEKLRNAGEFEVKFQLRWRHLRKNKHLRNLLQEGRTLDMCSAESLGQFAHFPPDASSSSGEDPFPSKGRFVWPKGVDRKACAQHPGFLDLFSGNCGHARELARLTGRWVLVFDVKLSKAHDLSVLTVQDEIWTQLKSGRFCGLSASPGSGTFSVASTPKCRTVAFPLGVPGLTTAADAKVQAENSLVEFVAQLCLWCAGQGIPFWADQPASSLVWRLASYRTLESCDGVGAWIVDLCTFGAPWRKRTRVVTSTNLAHQSTTCFGCAEHHHLRGRSRFHRRSWSSIAESFPRGMALVLAMALSGACDDRPEFHRLDAAACARALSLRPGEADHPGPRGLTSEARAASRAGRTLASVSLVEPQTEGLEVRLWRDFTTWVSEDCDAEKADFLTSVSATVAPLLGEYGEHRFQLGSSLSYFRHLLAYAQRELPDFRLRSRPCWESVSRWEQLEPLFHRRPLHRRPLPGVLCSAMAALAIGWGWPRFAMVLLIAFKGIMRTGEVLAAYRLELVLPVEHMERTAEKHIREIYSEQELDQMDSIEEAAYEYLEEHVKISPVEILAVLSELGLIQVEDTVWSQLLEEEATDKLNEMPPE